MHVVEIQIEGEFYDSYIYSGRLFLWTRDGAFLSVDWNELVEGIDSDVADRVALGCAFRYSSLLYGEDISFVLKDQDIRPIIVNKFQKLGTQPFTIDRHQLERSTIRRVDNTFDFPHADAIIYRNALYVGSSRGLETSEIRRTKGRRPIPTFANRLWDGPTFDLAASRLVLATASGSEGAWEIDLRVDSKPRMGHHTTSEPTQVTQTPVSAVEWMYASLFCSNEAGGELLTADPRASIEDEWFVEARYNADFLFGESVVDRYTWGVKEKLCSASDSNLRIIRYNPYKHSEDEQILDFGVVGWNNPLKGRPIKADSSYFGFVLEIDDGLFVVGSNGENCWFAGEPVNWRVFRNSKDYENQLHIVNVDHLRILSFNDDFIVDQHDKKVGLSHTRTATPKAYSRSQY